MIAPRRFLPPIGLLLAFEGVARTGSVTRVAEELSLTQSAVSRQVRALEEQLGAALFVRERKRLKLTEAGAAYADEIRDALQKIARASLDVAANPAGGALNLAILPTFGVRWLAPRLGEFARLYPEITINLSTRLQPFDFERERLDAAIHFGAPNWPGAAHVELMTETVVPVCAPALAASADVARAADVLRLPLLHLETRPSAWMDWFAANSVAAPPLTGMRFDQFGAMAQAAIHGLGVALMPAFLIDRELSDGRLTPIVRGPIRSSGAYYLVWPPVKSDYPPLRRFRDWIVGQVA